MGRPSAITAQRSLVTSARVSQLHNEEMLRQESHSYGTSLSLEQQYSRRQSSVWLLISSRINAQNTVLLFCLQLTSVMLLFIILIWKQAQSQPSY